MEYPVLKTPIFFSVRYEELTPKLLNQYFEYMMTNLETRIWVLIKQTTLSPVVEHKEIFSHQVMDEVFDWAIENLEIRKLSEYTKEELLDCNLENAAPYELSRRKFLASLLKIKNENHSAINMIDIHDYKLLMDLGLYFGECLRQRIDGAEWGVFKKKKYDITNHLVIFFSNGAAFCPFSEVELLLGDYESEFVTLKDRMIELKEMD